MVLSFLGLDSHFYLSFYGLFATFLVVQSSPCAWILFPFTVVAAFVILFICLSVFSVRHGVMLLIILIIPLCPWISYWVIAFSITASASVLFRVLLCWCHLVPLSFCFIPSIFIWISFSVFLVCWAPGCYDFLGFFSEFFVPF